MAKTKIGRPRSEKSLEAILTATHDLLTERGGAGLTIEAIARHAGVGKPTIYRWWPSLADLVLEVVLRRADADIPVPARDTLPETLEEFLRESMKAIADWGGPHLCFLMAQAQMDKGFRERFRENFVAKRRAVLGSILNQAAKRGEIGPERDIEVLVDIVFGAMWYRLLTGHAPMDDAFADELAGIVMGAVRADRPDENRRG